MARLILWLTFCFMCALFITVMTNRSYTPQSIQAENTPTIDLADTTSISRLTENGSTVKFFVSSANGYLFKSNKQEELAAFDFISNDPQVINDNVQGVSTSRVSGSAAKKLFPKELAKKIVLNRRKTDKDGTKHYYFRQKLDNKQIFGSEIAVHIRRDGEVYAVGGSLVVDTALGTAVLSQEEAKQQALTVAAAEYKNTGILRVMAMSETIFNSGIINGVANATNHKALEIVIGDSNTQPTFAKKYIIALDSGDVLFSEELIHEALNRQIYDCDGGLTSCPIVRREGSQNSNRRDADLMYDLLGDSYNFYKNNYNRDSYDAGGAPLLAFVNVESAQVACPNAAWVGSPYNQFLICPNMVVNDVIAHEYTHAVTGTTARLIMNKQSGALNEGISDIFSFGLDNDWTIGEDTALGIIRNAADPTTDRIPHPDRLFSQHYRCGTADYGGVHSNMTIITKAFYLMSEGGTFNTCSISGIGKTTALPIWYKALTTYLSQTSNFSFAYSAVMQACYDLYGATSNTCHQVQKAFLATQIDQQPSSSQDSPVCNGGQPTVPQCGTAPTATSTPIQTPIVTPTITVTIIPTVPVTATPTSTVTVTPTSGACAMKSKGDADCNGLIDLLDFEMWRKEFMRTVTSIAADFNSSGVVDMLDFEFWRKGYFGL